LHLKVTFTRINGTSLLLVSFPACRGYRLPPCGFESGLPLCVKRKNAQQKSPFSQVMLILAQNPPAVNPFLRKIVEIPIFSFAGDFTGKLRILSVRFCRFFR
jgi:hypothetical protein